jgi:hypothetical protein
MKTEGLIDRGWGFLGAVLDSLTVLKPIRGLINLHGLMHYGS